MSRGFHHLQGNKANLWQRYADMQLRYGPEHFNFLPESFVRYLLSRVVLQWLNIDFEF